jgi:hypothetical protein
MESQGGEDTQGFSIRARFYSRLQCGCPIMAALVHNAFCEFTKRSCVHGLPGSISLPNAIDQRDVEGPTEQAGPSGLALLHAPLTSENSV